MTIAAPSSFPLRVGRRTLWRVELPLARRRLTLEEALAGELPALPSLPDGAAGYHLTGLPAHLEAPLRAAFRGFRLFVRQRYHRRYAALDGDFDAYLATFSGKSRATLRRKAGKLGAFELLTFRTPDEIVAFHSEARAISARSYQERLLEAGLPDGEGAVAAMRALAARHAARGWLLRVDGRAISYLYAPAEGESLVYAHLGYDPEFAARSPGTVLQYEVMRQLMGERRFRWFDFTEGDGEHKRFWSTGSVESVDLLLLRPTAANFAAGHALGAFDRAIAFAKVASRALGLERVVRARLR